MTTRFATTQWSQVVAAQRGTEAGARQALESLCDAYWYPLYAFVRRQGHDPEAASDLTQAYFEQLLRRELLQSVDPSKGRFRSFLLASMRNFLSHERQKDRALKRGGGTTTLSLDARDAEERFRREPVEQLTPELLFERRWATTVMERAMECLEEESVREGGRERFELLKTYLAGSEPHLPYRRAAADLGVSEGAVKMAVYRLRRRYGQLIRDQIAETVVDPGEVDDELRHLLTVLRPAGDPVA